MSRLLEIVGRLLLDSRGVSLLRRSLLSVIQSEHLGWLEVLEVHLGTIVFLLDEIDDDGDEVAVRLCLALVLALAFRHRLSHLAHDDGDVVESKALLQLLDFVCCLVGAGLRVGRLGGELVPLSHFQVADGLLCGQVGSCLGDVSVAALVSCTSRRSSSACPAENRVDEASNALLRLGWGMGTRLLQGTSLLASCLSGSSPALYDSASSLASSLDS
jgi:hypothetical protein